MESDALHRRAFSLVELSIVLVILGLLVGGILSGQALIRAAQLRAVSAEYTRYVTAVHAFKDRYFALPGDFMNAQAIWGVAHATPATCVTTQGTGTQTCNGNGDGYLQNTGGSAEEYRFWQHLVNAGLIEGQYTGIAGPGGPSNYVLRTNSPSSRIPHAGWGTFWVGTQPVTTAFYIAGEYANPLLFGGNGPTENDYPNNPVISAEEAWNIDTKIDDGMPQRGKLMTNSNAMRPSCINATNDGYQLTIAGLNCNLMFPRPF